MEHSPGGKGRKCALRCRCKCVEDAAALLM
jgi:hypothetical protein